jgi:hypothetical protein
MKVYLRKDHILSRHFDNMEDDSADIFFTAKRVVGWPGCGIPSSI